VPALFDRSCFPELLALDDTSGAKAIILSNRERVAEFPFPEGKIDIDTAADYEKLNAETELAQRTQRTQWDL
jgi:molybdenum cofactor cytidylyltransferase